MKRFFATSDSGTLLFQRLILGLVFFPHGMQKTLGFEYHLLALALAIPLVVNGGGRWSIDHLLAGREATAAREEHARMGRAA